jgi:competence protein ComGC
LLRDVRSNPLTQHKELIMFNQIRKRRGFSYIEMTLSVTLMAVFMVVTFSKLGGAFDALSSANTGEVDDAVVEEVTAQFEGLGILGADRATYEQLLAELTGK